MHTEDARYLLKKDRVWIRPGPGLVPAGSRSMYDRARVQKFSYCRVRVRAQAQKNMDPQLSS
jgi:hypothetical protein